MLGRDLQTAAVVAVATVASLVAAQSPSFVEPQASILKSWTENQQYTVSWLAPYMSSTLEVYQGPLSDGQFVYETLASTNRLQS